MARVGHRLLNRLVRIQYCGVIFENSLFEGPRRPNYSSTTRPSYRTGLSLTFEVSGRWSGYGAGCAEKVNRQELSIGNTLWHTLSSYVTKQLKILSGIRQLLGLRQYLWGVKYQSVHLHVHRTPGVTGTCKTPWLRNQTHYTVIEDYHGLNLTSCGSLTIS